MNKHNAKLFYNSIESSADRITAIKKERISMLAALVHELSDGTEIALSFNEETGVPSVGNYEFEDNSLLVYGIRARATKTGLLIEINTDIDEDADDGLLESGWFTPNMIDENAENYLDPVYTARCLSAFIK